MENIDNIFLEEKKSGIFNSNNGKDTFEEYFKKIEQDYIRYAEIIDYSG